NQPVVGVSWFEARAYCNWLAAHSGLPIRLPTEAETEAATRGQEGRLFAHGDRFDAMSCNCVETHLRQPSPVGVFPSGATPEGAEDLTGNVFEWTSSAYARAPYEPLFAYPYRPDDGREEADTDLSILRVCRGGSWAYGEEYARASLRFTTSPASRVSACGFRVARNAASQDVFSAGGDVGRAQALF
ncbi:MAG: formylglycine-generating enzyme family protein, partial [Anaerolineae bacterium]